LVLDMKPSKELLMIAKYCDDRSLLVLAPSGIKRLRCPFKVTCLTSIKDIEKSDVVPVDQIGLTEDRYIIYVIKGVGYRHSYFRLGV